MNWKPIPAFPEYVVSDGGLVCHVRRHHPLLPSLNKKTGHVSVCMQRDGRSYNRSLALLVAKAFLPDPPLETFNTPIHLNGDRTNNEVTNLMWRPLWFARKYIEQFHNNQRGFKVPVEIIETGEQFPNSWEAAIKYGLIDRQILIATFSNRTVWPTGQTFRPLQNLHSIA